MGNVDYLHSFSLAAVVRFQPSTSTSLARALVGCQIPLQFALLNFYCEAVHCLNKFLRMILNLYSSFTTVLILQVEVSLRLAQSVSPNVFSMDQN
jgi:hypothetical protein